MNQALRHLWTRAYQNPIVEKEPRLMLAPVREPDRNMPSTALGSSKPRILIAKPKSLNRNDKIRQGLERAYPADYKNILDQAYAAYYYTNPRTMNLPELYELNESGFLDMGVEACGLHQWVIGRSK